MPRYAFSCNRHGEFDVYQGMDDSHVANCSCGAKAVRVFYPVPTTGPMPHKDPRPGKTRAELFDNLSREGLYSKNWREADEPNNKQWTDAGFKEKLVVGWTPALG